MTIATATSVQAGDCPTGRWRRIDGAVSVEVDDQSIVTRIYGRISAKFRPVNDGRRPFAKSVGDLKKALPSVWRNYGHEIIRAVGGDPGDGAVLNAVIGKRAGSTIALICLPEKDKAVFIEQATAEETYEIFIRAE